MPRRKARATVAEEASRPAAKNEVVSEVAALLAGIDSLSQSWPKGPDGQPVRLGDASMPKDVADHARGRGSPPRPPERAHGVLAHAPGARRPGDPPRRR